MEKRGLSIAHTTIIRRMHQYKSELDEIVRRHLKSWRVDETYVEAEGEWMYLCRAVDSERNAIDFYQSESRDKQAAKRFLKKPWLLLIFVNLVL